MGAHRVDPVDAIWLSMDQAENLMVIDCVMFLDGPVDRARFDRVVQHRLIDAYPVFSRRPSTGGRRGTRRRWRDVEDFDFRDHVHEVQLAAPGDDRALQDHVGRFLATPLPRDRPLWEIHLVEGLAEGSAIYVRLHHALADGIALTRVLLSLTDATADVVEEHPGEGGARRHGVASLIGSARRVAPEVRRGLAPAGVVAAATAAVRTGLRGAGVLGKLLLTTNPESALAGVAGAHKRAVWSDPIDLQVIKDIAEQSRATVNDVLVSALAGAIGRYQREHGGPPVDIPTMIPVNLRPMHLPLPRELGNRFALVLLLLPSGAATARERLAETKLRMDKIKRSPEPVITFAMIQGIGRLGRRLSRALVTFFAGKASGVTTNVPGPREPRYLAGTRITGLLGWVPGSGHQTLGTCIFSYAGTVRIGFKTDTAVIPDPDRILVAFHAEIEDLVHGSR